VLVFYLQSLFVACVIMLFTFMWVGFDVLVFVLFGGCWLVALSLLVLDMAVVIVWFVICCLLVLDI